MRHKHPRGLAGLQDIPCKALIPPARCNARRQAHPFPAPQLGARDLHAGCERENAFPLFPFGLHTTTPLTIPAFPFKRLYCFQKKLKPVSQMHRQHFTLPAAWQVIRPEEGREAERFPGIQKQAQRIRAAHPGAAVFHFYYFDDDFFSLTCFRAGKKAAALRSDASWAKMGKLLNAIWESDQPLCI